jgi:hypothetical protein
MNGDRDDRQDRTADSLFERLIDRAAHLCRRGLFTEAYGLLENLAFRRDFDLSASYGPRYRSYYGLCLAMVFGQISRGERLCREALETVGFHPDYAHNLGMVYLRCRRRDLAFQAFHEVIRAQPGHRATASALRRLGRRRLPLFSFLPRSHPLNKYTGMVLYRARRAWQGRPSSSAAAEASS